MPANYDNAAWFYDRLSRLVYRKALIKAQTAHLDMIPANAKILIAGGGTGWIIEKITKFQPSGLTIIYVELSAKMMALSQQRHIGDNKITFINQPIEEANLVPGFDVVITPFLLDSLPPGPFEKVFDSLAHLLKPSGLWLNADFQLSGKWWQTVLLKTMFLFFKLIGCVENTELPLIKERFIHKNYTVVDEQLFFGEFIVATAYRKE